MEEKEAKQYMQGLALSIVARRKQVGECQQTLIDKDAALKEARRKLEIAETFYKSELERLGAKKA